MLNSILLQVTLQDSLSVAAATVGTVSQTDRTVPVLELLSDEGTLYIIVPLAIFSIIAVYIFIERFLAIQKASQVNPNFMNQIKDFIKEGKIDSAKLLCDSTNIPVARMIGKGIKRIGKPMETISESIENEGKLEIYKLEKGVSLVAIIAGVAPMLGFLGTVMGMVLTFHNIKVGGQAVKVADLSGGIMQALVTTVAGLIVGIFAYLAYNILVTKIPKVIHQMETTSIEFIEILQELTS